MTVLDVVQTAKTAERHAGILRRVPGLGVAFRYGLSAAGPIAVSGAHFIASLIFLRNLSAHEFGLFSFVMVVVAFGMSLSASLIVVPITQSLVSGDPLTKLTCFKTNWLVCGLFALLLAIALWVSEAPLLESVMLGLFGAGFAWRWFARNMAYIDGRIGAAIRSDFLYSIAMVGSLGALALTHRMSFTAGSIMMLLSVLVAQAPFGLAFFRAQISALRHGRLKFYWPIFRDLSRWSLVGVALTEVTVNSHAYLVTFISGPGAFALLALGMLLMRPSSLVQSALPDMERPAMARAIAANDLPLLARIQRHFMLGLGAAWFANIVLCVAVLLFVPELILKKGYAEHDVALVAALSSVIMAIRALRVPISVMLQAAGQFKQMARLGVESGLVSVVATLALLLAFGPIASLLGIVLGELVILVRVDGLARAWRRAHG